MSASRSRFFGSWSDFLDFRECDLAQAVFDQTILEKADFRTAFNYAFDPEKNRLKAANFSLSGLAGLLQKYQINIEA